MADAIRHERLFDRWAHLGSNQGPPACEAGALPLSYAPKEQDENTQRHSPPPPLAAVERPLGDGHLLANVPVPGTGTKRMRKRHATRRSRMQYGIPGHVPVPGTDTQL